MSSTNLRSRFGRRSAAAPHEQEQQHRGTSTSDGKTPPIVASILTGRQLIIFSYICVWTCFYLLVHHASDEDEDSKISGQRQDSSTSSSPGNGREAVTNSAFFVICVEMLKILVSAGLYMKDHTLIGLRSFIRSGNMESLLLRYMPVAILYAIYNNLMFINLRSTHPSTYVVISSSRLVMTAIAWQMAFKVQISPIRLLAIILITSGILAKEGLRQGQDPVSKYGDGDGDEDLILSSYLATVMLILVQMACSVMAGIYNEKLLKNDVCNQYLQNICLYVNSIGINILIVGGIVISGKYEFDFASEMKTLMSPISISIVLTLATAGITSAMVLRYENSITKGIASASETALTAMVEWFWYGRVFMVPELFGITLVSAGTALYFFSPSTRKKEKPGLLKGAHSIRRAGLVASIFLLSLVLAFLWGTSYTSGTFMNPTSSKHVGTVVMEDESSTAICTKDASYRPRPNFVKPLQYNTVVAGDKVLAYIAKELNKIGAPMSLMFGTLLHEYRNGTGPCVQANFHDKDFDVAVSGNHFAHVLAMADDIEKRFGWTLRMSGKMNKRLFLHFMASKQRLGKGYQIDVYGFESDRPSKGLVYFPWDKITVATNAFLPLVKHKTLVYEDDNKEVTTSNDEPIYVYTPFNIPCLLANMYGADFMTPKKGHFIRRTAHGDPGCVHEALPLAGQKELEIRRSFVGPTSFKLAAKERFGIISCVRTRQDVIFVLGLAQSIHEQHENGTADFALELYHYSILSPYLTAKLELRKGVVVVDIKNPSTSCIVDSLAITRLTEVVLVDPSIILLPRPAHMQQKKMKSFSPALLCQSTSAKVGGSVTSTSLELDDGLNAFAKLQKDCKFQRAYSYHSSIQTEALAKHDILLKGSSVHLPSSYVGTMHVSRCSSHRLFSHTATSVFVYPVRGNIDWVSNHDNGSLVCGASGSAPEDCTSDVYSEIESYFQTFRYWKAAILLDRPVGWMAFDGGLVPQELSASIIEGTSEGGFCSSFNSLEGAKRTIRYGGGSDDHRTMLNIDLTMTLDQANVAMHSSTLVGPINFQQNNVQSPSTMTLAEVQTKLRNPCLPSDVIHLWLDENTYRSYDTCSGCSQAAATAKQFLDEIALGYDTDIIFDLKETSGQEVQVQQLLSLIQNDNSRSTADKEKLLKRVHLRYFGVEQNKSPLLEVLPDPLLKKMISGRSPSLLKTYINTPSKVACLELARWAREQGTYLAGCFVNEGHLGVTKSWHDLSTKINVTKTLVSMEDMKFICDVPREQTLPDTNLWKNGLVSCVEDGYDWIHYPFPVATKADYSLPSSSVLNSFVLDGTTVIKTSLLAINLKRSSVFQEYLSHWGITSPYNWKPHRQHWSFVGEKDQHNIAVQAVPNKNNKHVFRCVTKILTVMLFLRLEELGLFSVDDAIGSLEHKVTWKQVFSNTAGVDGTDAGNSFYYSNSLWSHVSDFVQTITGVPFVEAVKYYILDPIGLLGSFDVNTVFPPFTARGFLGSNEDLLLIGSTLASGGVSPKTRLRVISTLSVNKMLKDWTKAQNVTASFMQDKTVNSMKRFQGVDGDGDGGDSFAFGIVDGYGMGLWRVKGWRTKGHQVSPVRGWLAMGSSEAIIYFDTDDIVVGMCAPNRILGLELTASFAKVVREVGVRIDAAYLKHDRGNTQLRGEAKKTSTLS